MRPWKILLTLAALTCSLAGCFSLVDPVDEDLALGDAKASTQSIEREIIQALPSELVHEVEQKATGVFLPCSRGGGQQWAGGVTAEVEPGADPSEIIDPVERHFADDARLSVRRRVEDGDFLIDIAGDHSSFWILRYDPPQADLRIVSFSPCIYLPDDVSPGDKY